jgi:hypothetical protein
MTITATAAHVDEDTIWVSLADGCTLGVPLAWVPRLLAAPPEARADVTLSPYGLHWEALDEDISVPALMAEVPGRAAE